MSNTTQDDIKATFQGTVVDFTGTGFDATRAFMPTVVYNGVSYVMLYGGVPFGNNIQIGRRPPQMGPTGLRTAPTQ